MRSLHDILPTDRPLNVFHRKWYGHALVTTSSPMPRKILPRSCGGDRVTTLVPRRCRVHAGRRAVRFFHAD